MNKEKHKSEPGVVDLADARERLQRSRPRANVSREELLNELEEIRALLDLGLSTEVKARLTPLMSAARHDASLLAQARCVLSAALEMQGHYRESLEAVQMYELPESRAKLDAEATACLRVQIGLVYNYTGDQPKAIALLNTALREESETGSHAHLGAIYSAMARVYRNISEFTIARDHSQKALENYRETGGPFQITSGLKPLAGGKGAASSPTNSRPVKRRDIIAEFNTDVPEASTIRMGSKRKGGGRSQAQLTNRAPASTQPAKLDDDYTRFRSDTHQPSP